MMLARVLFVLLAGVPFCRGISYSDYYDAEEVNDTDTDFYDSYNDEVQAPPTIHMTTVTEARTDTRKRKRDLEDIRTLNPEEINDVKGALNKILHLTTSELPIEPPTETTEATDSDDYLQNLSDIKRDLPITRPEGHIMFKKWLPTVQFRNVPSEVQESTADTSTLTVRDEQQTFYYQPDASTYSRKNDIIAQIRKISPIFDGEVTRSSWNDEQNGPNVKQWSTLDAATETTSDYSDNTQVSMMDEQQESTYSNVDVQAEIRKLVPHWNQSTNVQHKNPSDNIPSSYVEHWSNNNFVVEHQSPPSKVQHYSPQHYEPPSKLQHYSPQYYEPPSKVQHYTPQHDVPSGKVQHYSPHHEVPSSKVQHYSPQHDVPSSKVQNYSPHHDVPSSKVQHYSPQHYSPQHDAPSSKVQQHYSPQHDVPPSKVQHYSPHYDVPSSKVQHYSPQHDIPSSKVQHYSPQHDEPPNEVQHYSPKHDVPSSKLQHYSPQHDVPPNEVEHYSPQHDVPPSEVQHYSPQHDVPPNEVEHYSPQHDVPPSEVQHYSPQHDVPPSNIEHWNPADNVQNRNLTVNYADWNPTVADSEEEQLFTNKPSRETYDYTAPTGFTTDYLTTDTNTGRAWDETTNHTVPPAREGETEGNEQQAQETKMPTTIPTTTTTTTTIATTTTPKSSVDIDAIMAIISNLTYDYEWNLTEQFNKSLIEHGVPTCANMKWGPDGIWTATTLNDSTAAPYDFDNTSVVSKCFVCGLKDDEIPRDANCADAFAGDFLPLMPVDARSRGRIASYRKYCRHLDTHNFIENPAEPRAIYGRFTGGCAVRWTDITGVYTQRTCRSRYRPLMGKHFASKRMAKLELALVNVDDGCIISPMATLLPVSRGISLYARFHTCVCSTNWCNIATHTQASLHYTVIIALACWLAHYT